MPKYSIQKYLEKDACFVSHQGECLVYFSDRDVPFFRVSFSPIFSRTGHQYKAIFLEPVVNTSQKGKFG